MSLVKKIKKKLEADSYVVRLLRYLQIWSPTGFLETLKTTWLTVGFRTLAYSK